MRLALAPFAVPSMWGADPGGGGGGGGGAGGGGGGAPADNGGGGAMVAGADGAPCKFFHNGWDYRTMTLYQPGKDPIIDSVSGTADFNDDGTFKQDYYIGDIPNSYSGTYT